MEKCPILTLINESWSGYTNIRQGRVIAKNITQEKKGCFNIIKGLIHQKDIKILNTYVPNNRASKYIK